MNVTSKFKVCGLPNFLLASNWPTQSKIPRTASADARGQKTKMMGLPGREKSLAISSAVWIKSTNVTDRQRDGRTDGHWACSKDRAIRHSVALYKQIVSLLPPSEYLWHYHTSNPEISVFYRKHKVIMEYERLIFIKFYPI